MLITGGVPNDRDAAFYLCVALRLWKNGLIIVNSS